MVAISSTTASGTPTAAAMVKPASYHHEQGLSRRSIDPQEPFVPETLESFAI